jgi:hypothetical protein
MNQVNIKHIANLNNESVRGLKFYRQELGILQERLNEIAKGNNGKEASERIGHFQNAIMIHQAAINQLKHRIKNNNKNIEVELVKTGAYVDANIASEHEDLTGKYQSEEHMFNELRHDFNRFAAQWM